MPRLPLFVYLAVYVFTCLIGALLMLFSDSFTTLVQLMAGANSFWLSSEDVFLNFILLFCAPALLVAGYELGLRAHWRKGRSIPRISPGGRWFPVVLAWAATWIIALVSLARGGAFRNVAAWGDYRQWVLARWQLFDTLSFLEWANIYNFLPVATTLLLLRVFESPHSRTRRALTAFAVALPALIVDLLLFQKKTLLVFALLVVLATLAYRDLLSTDASRRTFRFLFLTGACAYVLYCILVTGPALSRQAHAMAGQPVWVQVEKRGAGGSERKTAAPSSREARPSAAPVEGPPAPPAEQAAPCVERRPTIKTEPPVGRGEPGVGPTGRPIVGESARRRFLHSITEKLFPGRWIGIPPESALKLPELSRGPALFAYAVVGPFVRTSMPALAYPVVYPRQLPFYGLDVGLDIFGLGQMPRDNIYIHKLLWPAIHGGTIMAPAQFSFFSEVGLGGALLLSALTGYIMSAVWVWLLGFRAREIRAVSCSLMLIFAIYVAGDSLRNGLLAGYGVFWGALFLALWSLLSRVFRRDGSPAYARTEPG